MVVVLHFAQLEPWECIHGHHIRIYLSELSFKFLAFYEMVVPVRFEMCKDGYLVYKQRLRLTGLSSFWPWLATNHHVIPFPSVKLKPSPCLMMPTALTEISGPLTWSDYSRKLPLENKLRSSRPFGLRYQGPMFSPLCPLPGRHTPDALPIRNFNAIGPLGTSTAVKVFNVASRHHVIIKRSDTGSAIVYYSQRADIVF